MAYLHHDCDGIGHAGGRGRRCGGNAQSKRIMNDHVSSGLKKGEQRVRMCRRGTSMDAESENVSPQPMRPIAPAMYELRFHCGGLHHQPPAGVQTCAG